MGVVGVVGVVGSAAVGGLVPAMTSLTWDRGVASAAEVPSLTRAPGSVVVHRFGGKNRVAKHWTARAMLAVATPRSARAARTSMASGATVGAARLTARPSRGSKVVGALFYSDGTGSHFCTASVIASANHNLLVTAAHCMYSHGWKANVAFVPGYRNGRAPYGIWPVVKATMYSAWTKYLDHNFDYTFLQVRPPKTQNLQVALGATDRLKIDARSGTWVVVTGYPLRLRRAIYCLNKATAFSATQLEFRCAGFSSGTSGGPWDADYNWKKGTGNVIGVTGGYELGGIHSWISYSVRFGAAARSLYERASR